MLSPALRPLGVLGILRLLQLHLKRTNEESRHVSELERGAQKVVVGVFFSNSPVVCFSFA